MADARGLRPARQGRSGLLAEARTFGALALPMVVSRLGVAGFGLADGLMLARFNAEQLAVNGLAESVMGRALDIAMMVATAGLALVAQARAGGLSTAHGVGPVWQNALLMAVALGLGGVGVGLIGGDLLQLLGQPPDLVPHAARVLLVLGLGMAPALVGLVCAGVLEALGRQMTVAVAVVLANVLNIGLNMWFIEGGAGLPAMGAFGSALSTLLVRVGLAMALLAALWWLPGRRAYALREPFTMDSWRQGREFRQRGFGGAANVAVLALLSMGMPVMAGWLGTSAVIQITSLFLALSPAMVLVWGLGDAAGLRVAELHGGRMEGRVRRGTLQRSSGRLSLLLAGLLAVAVLACTASPHSALVLVSHDPALVKSLLPLLPLGLGALVGDAVSAFFASMLRSLGALRGPFYAHLASGLLVVPLGWVLAFPLELGLAGLLTAHGAAAVLRGAVLAWMYLQTAGHVDGRRRDQAAAA